MFKDIFPRQLALEILYLKYIFNGLASLASFLNLAQVLAPPFLKQMT